MSAKSNILYGGFEGSEAEICENTCSLGELLRKKLQSFDSKVLLVMIDAAKLFDRLIKQYHFEGGRIDWERAECTSIVIRCNSFSITITALGRH